jgi:hypothetical protein
MNTPIQSHLLKAVANYLGPKQDLKQNAGLAEGDALLESLFFQHTLVLNAINSAPELTESVRGAMTAEIERMKSGEPLLEEPSNIIVPDHFKP